MNGIGPTIINYLKLVSRLSPFFLVFFLVAVSLFDSQWGIKGFVYLACILMLSLVIYIIAMILGPDNTEYNKDVMCHIFDYPMGDKSIHNPALNSAIIAYTFVYLIYPMVTNDTYNYGVMGLLTVLYVTDTFMTLYYKCTNPLSIILGTAIGAVLSFGVVFMFLASGNASLLFFNELRSNNMVCKRPAKQNFKCKVYQNGELISGFNG